MILEKNLVTLEGFFGDIGGKNFLVILEIFW